MSSVGSKAHLDPVLSQGAVKGASENAGAAPRPWRGLREAEALSSAAPGPPQLALPKRRSPRGRAAQDPFLWDVSAPPPSSRDSQGAQSRSSACAAPTWPPGTPAHSATPRSLLSFTEHPRPWHGLQRLDPAGEGDEAPSLPQERQTPVDPASASRA